MDSTDFFLTALGRAETTFKRALDGLSPEELIAQPGGKGSNPIGWLAMHLTRVQDGWLSRIQGKDSEWDTNGWAEKFGLDGEAPQWTPENVHTFRPSSVDLLISYWDHVRPRTEAYVNGLEMADLDVELPPTRPGAPVMTLGDVLAVILGDNIQHIGQIAYLRGLVKDQGWY